MLLPNLFDDEPDPDRPAQAGRLASALKTLAERGVFLGTSSWKYEGWMGSIYSEKNYLTRGKFSKRKFEEECLAEYARIFPVVCGDFSFYQVPSEDYWARLFGGVPRSFRFAFKAPEELTVAKRPDHPRLGVKAGTTNENFLDPALFRSAFAERLEPYKEQVAVVVFEFGTFAKSTFADVRAFLQRLYGFLEKLPEGFRYAVEIRNPEYLGDDYFELLANFKVAHVYNAWTRTPELSAQLDMSGSDTTDFLTARALLAKGRAYEQAVNAFEPYRETQEVNEGARRALARIAELAIRERKPAFLFVNNRLEGHAPSTIEAVAKTLLSEEFGEKPGS